MKPNVLVLGGTTEARSLGRHLAAAGIKGTVSLAGRVARPMSQSLPQRIGGFGGAAGLAEYLNAHGVTHLVDATHPFAARMSHNAISACAASAVPLIGLTRPPWKAQPGDDWHPLPDIAGAVAALNRPRARVMLAVGRMHLAEFAPNAQHFYLLRLVDPPQGGLPFKDVHVVIDRGPFTVEDDLALMRRHGIDLVVSKNSGGDGASAKLIAARRLGIPVLMIERPTLPPRREAHDVAEVLAWLAHTSTNLGV